MNRKFLKDNAKFVLRKHFVMLFIVSLIMWIVGGGTGGSGNRRSIEYEHNNTQFSQTMRDFENDMRHNGLSRDGMRQMFEEMPREFSDSFNDNGRVQYWGHNLENLFERFPAGRLFTVLLGTGIALLAIGAVLLVTAFSIFVAYPIIVGGKRIFLETADGEHPPKLGKLAFIFTSGHYLKTVLAGFLVSLYTFLWSLLFVIPGIVKMYAYRFVPYIMADNPAMTASEAINLSKSMTRGHKWDLFVLDLSFIGWFLLGALAYTVVAVMGMTFLGFLAFMACFLILSPYMEATWAQAYLNIRGTYFGAAAAPAETVVDARDTNAN